jgi:hypothetical protein
MVGIYILVMDYSMALEKTFRETYTNPSAVSKRFDTALGFILAWFPSVSSHRNSDGRQSVSEVLATNFSKNWRNLWLLENLKERYNILAMS